tara:strand:+ start:483 stop:620 length:138 start_codon:yes stop_codon:yes gene_type:complete
MKVPISILTGLLIGKWVERIKLKLIFISLKAAAVVDHSRVTHGRT